VIQGCKKQVERKEGYELHLVMAMVMSCQQDGITLALRSQQLVVMSIFRKNIYKQMKSTTFVICNVHNTKHEGLITYTLLWVYWGEVLKCKNLKLDFCLKENSIVLNK